jgi:hypothetical protein
MEGLHEGPVFHIGTEEEEEEEEEEEQEQEQEDIG